MNTPGLLPSDVSASPAPANALYEQLLSLDHIGERRARYIAGLFMMSEYPPRVRYQVMGGGSTGEMREVKNTNAERSVWNLFLWQLINDPDKLYNLHNKRQAPPVLIIIEDAKSVPEADRHLAAEGNIIHRFDRSSIQSLRAWALDWAVPVQPDAGIMDRWLGGRKSKLPKTRP